MLFLIDILKDGVLRFIFVTAMADSFLALTSFAYASIIEGDKLTLLSKINLERKKLARGKFQRLYTDAIEIKQLLYNAKVADPTRAVD